MNLQEVLIRLERVKKNGHGYMALCPAHDDRNPSLSITEKGGILLLHCHAGCTYEEVINAIRPSLSGNTGYEIATARQDGSSHSSKNAFKKAKSERGAPISKEPVADYHYLDVRGDPVYTIVRLKLTYRDGSEDKDFVAKRRQHEGEAPKADGWIYNLKGVELIPYNLPEVVKSDLIYIVEGEKDVETLRSVGLTGTCNPFGAGKWKSKFNRWFEGKVVVILPDNDGAGLDHSASVAESLNGITKETLIVNLPGLPDKGDVSGFIENGGTADDLMDLVQRADPWKPNVAGAAIITSKFHFTTLNELLNEPAEEISFVWDRTLPCGGFSLCSAKPKVGKSTVARNLTVSVASGSAFLDRPTSKGPVLYLCLEEKRSEVRNHFERMDQNCDDIYIHTGATPEEAIKELELAIAEYQPILVIIDPLSRVLRVRDFNDYGSMSRGLEPFIDLARRSGCHILALHHDSKMDRTGGDALLGSTALFGSVDCHIQMRKKDGRRTLMTTQRYGEDMPETVVELDNDTGIIRGMGDLSHLTRAKAKSAILEVFSPDEKLEEKVIKERIEGFNHGILAKALRELVDEAKIGREGEGKRGKPYVYEVLSDVEE